MNEIFKIIIVLLVIAILLLFDCGRLFLLFTLFSAIIVFAGL